MLKFSAAVVASTFLLALTIPAFAAETDSPGSNSAATQGQGGDNTSAAGSNPTDSTGASRDQSAQMPKPSPGRVQEEKEQGEKNGQDSRSGQTPALEKRDNDAGSAQSNGPASPPAR